VFSKISNKNTIFHFIIAETCFFCEACTKSRLEKLGTPTCDVSGPHVMLNLPIGFMWKDRLHQTIAWSTAAQHGGILLKFEVQHHQAKVIIFSKNHY
jgi:hypothetical protein